MYGMCADFQPIFIISTMRLKLLVLSDIVFFLLNILCVYAHLKCRKVHVLSQRNIKSVHTPWSINIFFFNNLLDLKKKLFGRIRFVRHDRIRKHDHLVTFSYILLGLLSARGTSPEVAELFRNELWTFLPVAVVDGVVCCCFFLLLRPVPIELCGHLLKVWPFFGCARVSFGLMENQFN